VAGMERVAAGAIRWGGLVRGKHEGFYHEIGEGVKWFTGNRRNWGLNGHLRGSNGGAVEATYALVIDEADDKVSSEQ
jgi:hypothetical protein